MLEEILEEISKNMVFVKGGTLMMGRTPEQGINVFPGERNYDDFVHWDRHTKPVHKVTVSDFYISKYPVTQKQWREVMKHKAQYVRTCDNCPVQYADCYKIEKFLAKINRKTGLKYRLPTEAEWEFAARGGLKTKGYRYAGSNNLHEVAWYSGNSGYKTHPVGQKKPNELGLYDMTGNVDEWCEDIIGYSKYDGTPIRAYRGGDYCSPIINCRIASRSMCKSSNGNICNGFRLVLTK